MIENKKYFIDLINSSKANKFTEYYHYSGVGFKKAKINLGIFRKEDNLLVGVLQWGISAQEHIRLDRYVKEPITKEEYLELNRFCMADSEGKNAESQAISLGIQWIKKNCPNIKLLVSYAGRKEGNYGYIYQATNWEYLGYFISPGFWLLDGQERHMLTVWINFNRHKTSKEQTLTDWLCEKYQDVRQTWTKQFVYIQRLDSKLTAATALLPYPKPSNECPIKTKEKIVKEGVYETSSFVAKETPIYYWEKEEQLFSRAALIRQGKIEREFIAQYDNYGKIEKTYSSTSAITKENQDFKSAGIRKAIETKKIYKNKYFRKFSNSELPQEEIEVSYVAIVDEIPFASYSDVARYLNVSRQAISFAKSKHSTKIANKEIVWGEEEAE